MYRNYTRLLNRNQESKKALGRLLQTLKYRRCKERYVYPANFSITVNGGKKIFHDKTRFKQHITTNLALQKNKENHKTRKLTSHTKTQATDNLS